MSSIKTRVFVYGDEHESDWPPQMGTGGGGLYHIDKETGQLVEGPPPSKILKYGEAPFVIPDNCEPFYHHGACKMVDTRSGLRAADKASGCVTVDKFEPAPKTRQRELARERQMDNHKALHKAVAQLEAGTAPLTDETRQLCEATNERIASATGWDTFNVIGKKKNKKGKKYRGK